MKLRENKLEFTHNEEQKKTIERMGGILLLFLLFFRF